MKSVREIIQNEMENEQAEMAFVNHLCLTLEKFEGKQVTARISTAVKKMYESEHPGNVPNVTIGGVASSHSNLIIWGGFAGDYEHRHSYMLCYNSDPIFTMEAFKKHNPAYFEGAEKRQEQRRELLVGNKPEVIQDKIDAFKKAQQELKENLDYGKEVPDYFDICREFDLPK